MESDDLRKIMHNLDRLMTIFLIVIIVEAGIISGVILIAQTNFNNIQGLSTIVDQLSKTVDHLDDDILDQADKKYATDRDAQNKSRELIKDTNEKVGDMNSTLHEIRNYLINS